MNIRLRWKILLFTVFPPVILTAAALWFVNRNFSEQVHGSVRETLERSSMLFEHMLAARFEKLVISCQVVVRDPRFFSIVALPGSERDPHYRETVKRVATDFQAVARSDVFEVLDRRGRLLASVGTSTTSAMARDSLVRLALRGQSVSGFLIERDQHLQAAATPVFDEGRVVGVLVLGSQMGDRLARELRTLTRSEVTFVSGNVATGTSLGHGETLEAVLQGLRERRWMEGSEAIPHWTAAAERPARPAVFDLQVPGQIWVTLLQSLPESSPAARQLYLMQRSLDAETAFLTGVRHGLVQLGLIAALAALIAGLVISEQITRPVHRLVRGAVEMERGNYEYPLAIKSRDEIGFLARHFEEMRHHERNYVGSLEEVARLKGDFLNVASHELRTPISIIKGYHELFASGALGPVAAAQVEALEAIAQGVESLERIAEDATWMAQLEGERPTLEPADHEVVPFLEGAVKAGTSGAKDRQVSVTISAEQDLGTAHIDAARLSQAIAGLIRNGIRFTPDGGAVLVVAWHEAEELVIEVRDSGIGIAAEEQKNLFNRPVVLRDSMHHHSSSSLEFKSSGLGMGLAIARAIVEAHDGTISVTSEPGVGSTFTIRLPDRADQPHLALVA